MSIVYNCIVILNPVVIHTYIGSLKRFDDTSAVRTYLVEVIFCSVYKIILFYFMLVDLS